ncbi:MAG: nitrogenase-stabilizing/protective protein NifW [Candidatus Accumulibacter phosphatis]|uniref:Nitrogenase-stabilizing/protective protein NifW n=1 Tax=Candidatus Accumulibacter cognatus TaxID=2954383 RepID=A0A7D5NBN9_9PROT|nr:nitrogenase-stabilizing/protective protein NifW [Accumulibacter sp.]MCC2866383.1 nitrogenase-stabilizing/protective protein NifW [Candidatus Accumulibacter phosphatis]QLH49791.1 MAG: nitrogenase-stabilizing/protective protein NifW [Candidatus Accumulibacter cognatus]MBL8401107.1 nitrogenase-stabilizing/protective protein NifW [Accumulibacter sp.]MBN8519622.1 nitrogenase-stabilizing/protective protein NifW [Accumulibacter sp.]MBO3709228.1 nitrogenase-stabilizing/protective protein NifW [Accu
MACANDTFEDEFAELSSAEEFLDYFGIDYAAPVVQVNRLHILQRFHDYLAKQEAGKAPDYLAYRHWLACAYTDFVGSSAQAEKVFAVFRKAEGSSFVPLSSLTD